MAIEYSIIKCNITIVKRTSQIVKNFNNYRELHSNFPLGSFFTPLRRGFSWGIEKVA